MDWKRIWSNARANNGVIVWSYTYKCTLSEGCLWTYGGTCQEVLYVELISLPHSKNSVHPQLFCIYHFCMFYPHRLSEKGRENAGLVKPACQMVIPSGFAVPYEVLSLVVITRTAMETGILMHTVPLWAVVPSFVNAWTQYSVEWRKARNLKWSLVRGIGDGPSGATLSATG